MNKSELRALIKETIEEMAKAKKPIKTARKAKAAAKGYTLKPSPDPIMDGEMELRVRGKVVATLWPSEQLEGETCYMLFPSESEYGTMASIEDTAKSIVKDKEWTW
jgi:hypothetical protein